ncbi:hypothetical protein KSS87_017582, partial [Heliosperma pusillum]
SNELSVLGVEVILQYLLEVGRRCYRDRASFYFFVPGPPPHLGILHQVHTRSVDFQRFVELTHPGVLLHIEDEVIDDFRISRPIVAWHKCSQALRSFDGDERSLPLVRRGSLHQSHGFRPPSLPWPTRGYQRSLPTSRGSLSSVSQFPRA